MYELTASRRLLDTAQHIVDTCELLIMSDDVPPRATWEKQYDAVKLGVSTDVLYRRDRFVAGLRVMRAALWVEENGFAYQVESDRNWHLDEDFAGGPFSEDILTAFERYYRPVQTDTQPRILVNSGVSEAPL